MASSHFSKTSPQEYLTSKVVSLEGWTHIEAETPKSMKLVVSVKAPLHLLLTVITLTPNQRREVMLHLLCTFYLF